MSENSIIRTSDYNTLRNSIIEVMGAGSVTYGYGQELKSSSKSDHEKISQTDWDLLRFDIVNSRTHQDGSAPVITDINEGDLLSFSNNTQYSGLIATARTNRFNVGAGQFLTENATDIVGSPLISTRTYSLTASPPTSWNVRLTCEITISFTNSDLCRWFFNSGGEIRIRTTRTGGTNNQQNNDWSSLLTSAGQRAFGAQTPSTGFTPMNGTNFYRLTSTYQPYYTLSSSSPYSSNSYNLDARCDVANNSSGTATTVYLRVRLEDGYTDPGPGGPPFTNDAVDGTFSVSVSEKRASGVLVPSGNFTITRPTYSITQLGST